jgi:hypothetical protein
MKRRYGKTYLNEMLSSGRHPYPGACDVSAYEQYWL